MQLFHLRNLSFFHLDDLNAGCWWDSCDPLPSCLSSTVFGLWPFPPVGAVVRSQRPHFPFFWHVTELKSITKCDRAIKKTDSQSTLWVCPALCPPWGSLSGQKLALWQLLLGMGLRPEAVG